MQLSATGCNCAKFDHFVAVFWSCTPGVAMAFSGHTRSKSTLLSDSMIEAKPSMSGMQPRLARHVISDQALEACRCRGHGHGDLSSSL